MVRRMVVTAILFLFCALPALAQENDFPRVEVSMGYASLKLPGPKGNETHSGFAMHSGLNLVRWFGVENYTGVYSLGNDITLITNITGGRLVQRGLLGGRVAPYLVAGLGTGYFTREVSGFSFGSTATAARYGAGVDINVNESLAVKVDASRMAFNLDRWRTNWNISAGIVFRVLY